jgi:hypothetical protein
MTATKDKPARERAEGYQRDFGGILKQDGEDWLVLNA